MICKVCKIDKHVDEYYVVFNKNNKKPCIRKICKLCYYHNVRRWKAEREGKPLPIEEPKPLVIPDRFLKSERYSTVFGQKRV